MSDLSLSSLTKPELLHRRYGYSYIGEPCLAPVSELVGERISLISAISCDDVLALHTVKGTTNAQDFF